MQAGMGCRLVVSAHGTCRVVLRTSSMCGAVFAGANLVGDRCKQPVEGALPVCGDDDQPVFQLVDIPDLALQEHIAP